MEPELIPEDPTARFVLLGYIGPSGHDGQCEWRMIIRCQEGEVLHFYQVAMGAGPMDAAAQMKEAAEALLHSSGYEIRRSPTTMQGWTATWDVIGTSRQQQGPPEPAKDPPAGRHGKVQPSPPNS
jgi:hypothetical protein